MTFQATQNPIHSRRIRWAASANLTQFFAPATTPATTAHSNRATATKNNATSTTATFG